MSAQRFYEGPLRAAALRLGSSLLHDCGRGAVEVVGGFLHNHTPELPLCGPVFPVPTSGSILPVLQAMLDFPAGHILLVVDDSNGEEALLGDIIMTAAKNEGVAGIVCAGTVRDVASAASIGLPLWATRVSPAAAKLGERAEQLPAPVRLGSHTISHGDWLVGDTDGMVWIPQDRVRFTVKSAELKGRREEDFIQRLREGERITDIMNVEAFLAGSGDIVVPF